jgi:hypothetical protein
MSRLAIAALAFSFWPYLVRFLPGIVCGHSFVLRHPIICIGLTVPSGLLGCLLSIVCGHRARREIRTDPDARGNGIALAGLIVSYTFLSLFAAATLLFAFACILAGYDIFWSLLVRAGTGS